MNRHENAFERNSQMTRKLIAVLLDWDCRHPGGALEGAGQWPEISLPGRLLCQSGLSATGTTGVPPVAFTAHCRSTERTRRPFPKTNGRPAIGSQLAIHTLREKSASVVYWNSVHLSLKRGKFQPKRWRRVEHACAYLLQCLDMILRASGVQRRNRFYGSK